MDGNKINWMQASPYSIHLKHKLWEAKVKPAVDKRMNRRWLEDWSCLNMQDIAYSVSFISQFMHNPREPHLQSAYRVLRNSQGNPKNSFIQE